MQLENVSGSMYLAKCLWLITLDHSAYAVISICMHKPMDNKNYSSRIIISTVCHFTSYLIVFISRRVVLPASTTVIRARKNKKRKKKRGFAILKCNVRCLKLVFLLNFTPRLVSNRHIVIHPLGYGCLIEGGFDIECCNWIFSNFRLSTTYVVMSLNR
jgi:hypothetical protein